MGPRVVPSPQPSHNNSHPQTAHNMPQAHEYAVLPQPDHEPRPTSARAPSRENPTCAIICAAVVVLLWFSFLLATPRPFYAILFTVVAMLPAFLVAHFVSRKFKDEAVSTSFLFSQFIIGAIPLSFAVLFIEGLISILLAVTIFSSDLDKILKITGQAQSNQTHLNRTILVRALRAASSSSAEGKSASDLMADQIREILPLWKLLLMAVLLAFIVAALTEELGKWHIARRYKKVNSLESNIDNARSISCKGILSVACMGALGFATAEHAMFALGVSITPFTGFPLMQLGSVVFRSLLAFPVHVGTQCYIAVAAAQTFIFQEQTSVFAALVLAVVLHGTFDAVPLFLGLLYLKAGFPFWLTLLVPLFQVFLVVLLLLLCRGRYKALLDREQMLSTSEAPV